jgi:hypothetical protein
VVSHLFYRCHDETYDESRMISLPVDAQDGMVDLQFRLPTGIRPDYLRLDPADFPGIYGLSRVMLQESDDLQEKELPQLSSRLGHINGEWVESGGMPSLRLVSFDGDPSFEFEVGTALTEAAGDQGLQVTTRVDYEIVVSDPVLHRLLEQQAMVSMRQLSRARVDVQNLAGALSQQQKNTQELAHQFSQQREDIRSLTHAFSQQCLDALAASQQLQQSIGQLASRNFWSKLRRLIKRGR